MKPLVYLAGPISGCTYGGCTDWREYVQKSLAPTIIGLSPMRGKQYLLNEKEVRDFYPEYHMSTAKAITTRDRFDCNRADVVFVNLLGATKVSIGTVMEIAWADAARIPIIVVMEKEGNLHQHGMLITCAGWAVETLDEAIAITKAILVHGG